MRHLLAFFLLCGLCSDADAATPPKTIGLEPPTAPDASRFLFIVETSSSMRSLQEVTRSTLFDMIFTGLGGQMRTGDTFGVWTYSEETYAGQFPMQVWDAQTAMEVASRATLFLGRQKYTGETRIEILASKIRAVTRAVGDVTIFILSDGTAKFAEIPYADAINTEYQQRAKERSRAKKPFVTALIVRGGKTAGAYVALAGQPLPLPDRSASAGATKKAPTVPVLPNRSPVEPPTPASASAPESGITPALHAPEVKPPPVTPDSFAEAKTPDVVFTPTPAAASDPAPAPASTPAQPRKKVFQFVTHTNSPAPKPEPVPAETTVAATNSTPTTPTPTAAATPSATPPIPTPTATTTTAATPTTPTTPTTTEVTNLVSVGAKTEPPVASELPEAVTPQPTPSVRAEKFPNALPVAARELEGPTSAEMPAAPNAAAVPVTQGLSAGAELLIGGLLLVSAVFLIVIMLRSVRPAPQPSLITRSMERR